MRLLRGVALALLLADGTAALAEAPETSLRPAPRGAEATESTESESRTVVSTASAPARSLRPNHRPEAPPSATETLASAAALAAATVVAVPEPPRDPISAFISSLATPRAAAAAVAAPVLVPGVSALAVARSLRPAPRPGGLTLAALPPTLPPATPRATSRGSICGVNEIKGENIAPIHGPGRCGVPQAVRVSSVAGIPVAGGPTIDCTTAKALNNWVKNGIVPAVGRTGGGVARINIIASYSCRSRNNVRGAKLSEHALGHAVDFAGVTLRDGTVVTVEHDWNSRRFGKIVQAMWKSACGTFGTVLGPRADRYHYNHLHVDTARYRGGSYCR